MRTDPTHIAQGVLRVHGSGAIEFAQAQAARLSESGDSKRAEFWKQIEADIVKIEEIRDASHDIRIVPALGTVALSASSLTACRAIFDQAQPPAFCNRTPGPPPFSGMNSTPAASRAVRIAATVRG